MPFVDLPVPGWVWTGATAVLYAGAVVSALHAVMSARTPQGAFGWMIGLLTLPLVTLPLYWTFGHSKFGAYVHALQDLERDIQEQLGEIRSAVREQHAVPPDDPRGEELAFRDLATLPFTRGNGARLLIDGEATFDAILSAIDRAENYVLAQYYTVADDAIGGRFQQALIHAAERGVRVHFVYDDVGSYALPRSYSRTLKGAGVHVTPFSGRRAWLGRLRLNFRNHRKIVVVDGREAFAGGLNVADEYLGHTEKYPQWRDTHLALTGPTVQGVQLSFVRDWYWSTGDVLDLPWEPSPCAEDRHALVLATGPADPVETCGLFYAHAIQSAEERVWIATPYFVPDGGVLASLQLAALRGVDVRVLVPRRADHTVFDFVHYAYLKPLDEAGAKLFFYEPCFAHQKVCVVDSDFAAVGTANFDNRSFRLNFELTLLFADADFATEVAAMLDDDFAQSTRATVEDLDARPFYFHLGIRASRLLEPIL
ncbi:MAG: cardiolipin synthase [Bacteroidota bacterium]